MRGAVILISVVLVSCLTVEAHAGCNAERFDFGTSLETVMDAFNVEKSVERLPSLPGLSERFLQLSGKEVCPDDPAFAGATITYNFLADQLVEIQLELSQRASPRLTLLDWAIQRHGRPTIQTKGPVATMSSGQWTWERPKTFAFLYFFLQFLYIFLFSNFLTMLLFMLTLKA